MKKAAAYFIMILCYLLSNLACGALNALLAAQYVSAVISLILTCVCSLVFAILAIIIPNKIADSECGRRYKIFAIFSMIMGAVMGIGTVASMDYKGAYAILMIMISLINPTFIFGIGLLCLYVRDYVKKRKI